jgi:hypothetical protein
MNSVLAEHQLPTGFFTVHIGPEEALTDLYNSTLEAACIAHSHAALQRRN